MTYLKDLEVLWRENRGKSNCFELVRPEDLRGPVFVQWLEYFFYASGRQNGS